MLTLLINNAYKIVPLMEDKKQYQNSECSKEKVTICSIT